MIHGQIDIQEEQHLEERKFISCLEPHYFKSLGKNLLLNVYLEQGNESPSLFLFSNLMLLIQIFNLFAIQYFNEASILNNLDENQNRIHFYIQASLLFFGYLGIISISCLSARNVRQYQYAQLMLFHITHFFQTACPIYYLFCAIWIQKSSSIEWIIYDVLALSLYNYSLQQSILKYYFQNWFIFGLIAETIFFTLLNNDFFYVAIIEFVLLIATLSSPMIWNQFQKKNYLKVETHTNNQAFEDYLYPPQDSYQEKNKRKQHFLVQKKENQLLLKKKPPQVIQIVNPDQIDIPSLVQQNLKQSNKIFSQVNMTSSADSSNHFLNCSQCAQVQQQNLIWNPSKIAQRDQFSSSHIIKKRKTKEINENKTLSNEGIESPFLATSKLKQQPTLQTTIQTTEKNEIHIFKKEEDDLQHEKVACSNHNLQSQSNLQTSLRNLNQIILKQNNGMIPDSVMQQPQFQEDINNEELDIYPQISFDENLNIIRFSSNLFDILTPIEIQERKQNRIPTASFDKISKFNFTQNEKQDNQISERSALNITQFQDINKLIDFTFISILEFYETSKKREILQIFFKHDTYFKNQMKSKKSTNSPPKINASKNHSNCEYSQNYDTKQSQMSQNGEREEQNQFLLKSQIQKSSIFLISPALQSFHNAALYNFSNPVHHFNQFSINSFNYFKQEDLQGEFNDIKANKSSHQRSNLSQVRRNTISTLNNISNDLLDIEQKLPFNTLNPFQSARRGSKKFTHSFNRSGQNSHSGTNQGISHQILSSPSLKMDNVFRQQDEFAYNIYQFEKPCQQNSLRNIIGIIQEMEKDNLYQQVIYKILKCQCFQLVSRCPACEAQSGQFISGDPHLKINTVKHMQPNDPKKSEQKQQNNCYWNFENIVIDIIVNPRKDKQKFLQKEVGRQEKILVIFRKDFTVNFLDRVYFMHSVSEEVNKNKAEVLLVKKLFIDSFQSVSHEFGTALNCINNLAEAAFSYLPQDSVTTIMKPILYNSTLIQFLVNNILDHHMILQNTFLLEKTIFSLKEFRKEMIDLFYLQIEYKKLTFEILLDPILPDLIIQDKSRVQSILMTIIRNAIKYTQKGGIIVNIKPKAVFLNEKGNLTQLNLSSHIFLLSFEVEDTGVGLDEIEAKKLRQLLDFGFCDEKISKNSLGNGIGGLRVSNLIAIRLSGNFNRGIQFQKNFNNQGIGSIFIFQIESSSPFDSKQSPQKDYAQINLEESQSDQSSLPPMERSQILSPHKQSGKIFLFSDIQKMLSNEQSSLESTSLIEQHLDKGFSQDKSISSQQQFENILKMNKEKSFQEGLNPSSKQLNEGKEEISKKMNSEQFSNDIKQHLSSNQIQEEQNANDNYTIKIETYTHLQKHHLIQQQLLEKQFNLTLTLPRRPSILNLHKMNISTPRTANNNILSPHYPNIHAQSVMIQNISTIHSSQVISGNPTQLSYLNLIKSSRLESIQDQNYQLENLIQNLNFFREQGVKESLDLENSSQANVGISSMQLNGGQSPQYQSIYANGKKSFFNFPFQNSTRQDSFQQQNQQMQQGGNNSNITSKGDLSNSSKQTLKVPSPNLYQQQNKWINKLSSSPTQISDEVKPKQEPENENPIDKLIVRGQFLQKVNSLPLTKEEILFKINNEKEKQVNSQKSDQFASMFKISNEIHDKNATLKENQSLPSDKNFQDKNEEKEQLDISSNKMPSYTQFLIKNSKVTFGEDKRTINEETTKLKQQQFKLMDYIWQDTQGEGMTKEETDEIHNKDDFSNQFQQKDKILNEKEQSNRNSIFSNQTNQIENEKIIIEKFVLDQSDSFQKDKFDSSKKDSASFTPGFSKENQFQRFSFQFNSENNKHNQANQITPQEGTINEVSDDHDSLSDSNQMFMVCNADENLTGNFKYLGKKEENVSNKNEVHRKLSSKCCMKVLCVDDEPFNHYVMKAILTPHKIQFDSALDGTQAVQKFTERQICLQCGLSSYSLIFMDLNMPVKNGFEATAEIKEFVQTNHLSQVTVITCSAFIDLASKLKAQQCGSDFFLHKPINQKLLFEIIEHNFKI